MPSNAVVNISAFTVITTVFPVKSETRKHLQQLPQTCNELNIKQGKGFRQHRGQRK